MRISAWQKVFGFALLIGLAYIVGDYYRVFGGEPLYPIHGRVLLAGRPMPKGTIQFLPVESGHNRSSGGEIVNGAYILPDEYGLPRGKYQVRVSSLGAGEINRAVNAQLNGQEVAGLKEEVPVRYNEESKIVIDLTRGDLIEVDFDLK